MRSNPGLIKEQLKHGLVDVSAPSQ